VRWFRRKQKEDTISVSVEGTKYSPPPHPDIKPPPPFPASRYTEYHELTPYGLKRCLPSFVKLMDGLCPKCKKFQKHDKVVAVNHVAVLYDCGRKQCEDKLVKVPL
jgi:hypothetical protein